MAKYLIDENLPYYFSLWDNGDFVHVRDLIGIKTDNEIWEIAKERHLVIVSKDSDFSNKIMFRSPPPKVVHIRYGNVRIQKLHELLDKNWGQIEKEIKDHKLVNVFIDRIESIS